MNFLDLFAGIGGFRLGMELAGHTCVGWCEIDKYAQLAYKAIHNPKEDEWFAEDITKVSDESIRQLGRQKQIDVICAGFPCQPFSVAGRRKGFEDTRGTLFFEIARFAKILKPKYLFLENVKGLLNHQKGETFATILSTLDELGYDVEWQVLNSKDFGVPQNRERVFIIGHLRGQCTTKIFPISRQSHQTLKQIIDEGQDRRIYTPNGLSCTITSQGGGWGAKTGLYLVSVSQTNLKLKTDGIANCLDANYHKGFGNQERPGVLDNYRIRRLTPKECWRLQGFPDSAFEKAQKIGLSDTQLYKQAGNAVTIPVVYEIAKRMQLKEV